MIREPFNCYTFCVNADGGPTLDDMREHLREKNASFQKSYVFQNTLDDAVQNFREQLEESIANEQEPHNPNRQAASGLTVELKHSSPEQQGDNAWSVSFAIKYKGNPLPDLVCMIEKRNQLPAQIDIIPQKVAIGSRNQCSMDSARGAIEWYIERAKDMQRSLQ